MVNLYHSKQLVIIGFVFQLKKIGPKWQTYGQAYKFS